MVNVRFESGRLIDQVYSNVTGFYHDIKQRLVELGFMNEEYVPNKQNITNILFDKFQYFSSLTVLARAPKTAGKEISFRLFARSPIHVILLEIRNHIVMYFHGYEFSTFTAIARHDPSQNWLYNPK